MRHASTHFCYNAFAFVKMQNETNRLKKLTHGVILLPGVGGKTMR